MMRRQTCAAVAMVLVGGMAVADAAPEKRKQKPQAEPPVAAPRSYPVVTTIGVVDTIGPSGVGPIVAIQSGPGNLVEIVLDPKGVAVTWEDGTPATMEDVVKGERVAVSHQLEHGYYIAKAIQILKAPPAVPVPGAAAIPTPPPAAAKSIEPDALEPAMPAEPMAMEPEFQLPSAEFPAAPMKPKQDADEDDGDLQVPSGGPESAKVKTPGI